MNTSLQFLQSYCQFEQGQVWILTGLSRNKDNSSESHDFLRRLVLAKPSDIETCYQELRTLGNRKGTTYRIYISLNARDANKTFFNFQKKLLEINLGLYQGHQDALNLVTKVASLWKTELAQSQNRATKYFLLDVDDDKDGTIGLDINLFLLAQRIEPIVIHPTVSGTHIVIPACDTRSMVQFFKDRNFKVDIQKDSMVFVEQYAGNA